ncbi:hypothetical protein KUTeg_012365 [Tegillarca granosa]|uniref:Transporter n=1 Tax=Tegillarca granosa TaxID=220873 RepID=A0ABQ9F4H9_TEGGR|nr:hypothetical protein KUTeg_012365 [Tegillarca granosa]
MESNMDFPKRQGWNRPVEFLFAIIGYSVGMGNIWRFPYTCYESGGGAFILAYLIMWTFCGVPLLYMELAIGQYTRLGPLGAMEKLCPLFKGAAAGSVVVVAISRTLYMVIIVWPFYYLFNSFNQEFPWSRCGHDWNTQYCVDTKDIAGKSVEIIGVFFLKVHVLQITSGIDDFGTVRWEFALILLLTWILIYFSAFKGTKSVGKSNVVYVTVLFPYIVLILMIIRGFTLPGSYEGLLFLFTPKWYRLTEPQVWIHAAATNFFSLGIGGGGYLARTHGKPFEKIVTSGIELVFIVFPEIFTTMPLSQLMSVLFFLMIITLAFDTMLVGPEICVTAITDRFKKLPRKEILYAIACILFYCLGLPTIAQGGIYYFALLDYYLSFGSSVSFAFFEIVAVSWFYGRKFDVSISQHFL